MHDDDSKDVFERFAFYLDNILPTTQAGIVGASYIRGIWEVFKTLVPDLTPPIVETELPGTEMTWKNRAKGLFIQITIDPKLNVSYYAVHDGKVNEAPTGREMEDLLKRFMEK